MIQIPAASRLDNYALLLAEHGFTASTLAIGIAWVEWWAFIERRKTRIVIQQRSAPMAVTIRRPDAARKASNL